MISLATRTRGHLSAREPALLPERRESSNDMAEEPPFLLRPRLARESHAHTLAPTKTEVPTRTAALPVRVDQHDVSDRNV